MHTLLKPRNCGINKLTGGIEGITELAKIEELCVRVGLENTRVYQTLPVLSCRFALPTHMYTQANSREQALWEFQRARQAHYS